MVLNMAEVTHGGVSDYRKMHQGGVSSWPEKCLEEPVLPPPAPSRPEAILYTEPLLTLTPDKVPAGSRTHGHLNMAAPVLPSQLTTGKTLCTPYDIDSREFQMWGPVPVRLTSAEPDPKLAITPDKSTKQVSRIKSSLRKDSNSVLGIDKLKQRVRFDVDRQNDGYKQDNYCDKIVPNRKYLDNVRHDDNAQVTETVFCGSVCADTHLSSFEHELPFKPINSGTVNIPRKTFHQLDKEENLSLPVNGNSSCMGKVIVTREMQEQPVLTEYHYPFDVSSPILEEQEQHVFSRPEFHNSLKVYNELKAVSAEEVDVPAALAQHLALSTTTRQDISEKASLRVNQKYSSSVYSGLVGLQAPVEDLCQHTEKLISLKVKPKTQQKMSERLGPDLMEFYSEEMERESADFSQPSGGGGTNLPPEQLSTAPTRLAFDLYQHNRVWDRLLK